MRVAVIGVGTMGLAMAGHLIAKGHEVSAFDVDPARRAAAADLGARTAEDLAGLAPLADLFLLVVATDDQSRAVTRALCEHAAAGSIVVVAATNHPHTMQELAALCADHGLRFVDAPVVYGTSGAREGTLVSLCGGSEADVEAARPALEAYSRSVVRVGGVGAGQVGKTCNNLLHWIHCVGNFEALLLAKRFGIDAQRMREILLDCPAQNGTLRRWDGSRFTWQEKDMDVTLDLAQAAGLVLPLAGQVDQLMKRLTPADVKALLYGPEVDYLGLTVRPLSPADGGMGG